MKRFAQHCRLERLELQNDDNSWLTYLTDEGIQTLAEIPGFEDLARLASTVDVLTFSGNWPQFQDYIQSRAVEIREFACLPGM